LFCALALDGLVYQTSRLHNARTLMERFPFLSRFFLHTLVPVSSAEGFVQRRVVWLRLTSQTSLVQCGVELARSHERICQLPGAGERIQFYRFPLFLNGLVGVIESL